VIDITPAGAHAVDLVVRARRWAAEPKNSVAAIGEGERERHHERVVGRLASRVYHGEGQVDADDWDVALRNTAYAARLRTSRLPCRSSSDLAPVLYGPAIMIHIVRFSLP
jgi:hypothetical protein